MSTTLTHTHTLRELDYRESNGIAVSLLWNAETNALTVLVDDAESGDSFTVAAAPDKALDVFHHPFAYASSRESLPLVPA